MKGSTLPKKAHFMDYFSSEHINPFDENNPDFWMKAEHLGRYLYAAHALKKHHKARPNLDPTSALNTHLDIGCATGYGLHCLTHITKNVTGIDYDKKALEQAAQNCPDAALHHLDIDKRPLTSLQSQPFATLTAFEVLEHLENPQQAAHDMFAITQKGGLVLASFPNPRYERLNETGTPENPYHHHAQTLEESKTMFENAGFKVKNILGQPLCNRLFSRERNLYKNNTIPEKPFSSPELNTPERLHSLAHLLAWPEEANPQKSYTFIFELTKI